jgi:hypothetical protein
VCDTATRMDLAGADYDADGWSPYYGCGRIDAGAAVAAVANGAPAAPVPRLVAETAELPRVLLAWEPAVDPDGDIRSYRVVWTVGEETREATVSETVLDIAGDVADGDVVTWTVAAEDTWGEGPASEPVTFTVIAAPVAEALPEDVAPPADEDEAATCGGVGGGISVLAVLAAAAAGARRRRRARLG